MSKIFSVFLGILFLFSSACNQTGGENAAPINGGGPPAATNNCGDGRLGEARAPSQSVEAAMLVKNYWVFEFCIIADDPPRGRAKEGSWYRFNPDGTYVSGLWEEELCHGNWFITFPIGKKATLLLDSANDTEDSEFEIQGYSQDGMSWVGTKKFSQTNVIAKVINLLTKPTKAQFGKG